MKVQINITIPQHWKLALMEKAIEETKNSEFFISYLDLIRRAVHEKYRLKWREGKKQ